MPLQSRLGTSPRARCSPHQVPDRREAPSPRSAAGRPRCLGISRVSGAGRDEEGLGQGQDREPRPSPRRQRGVDAAGRRRWPLRSARACGALRGSLWRDPGGAAPLASPLAPPRGARADPALGPCARTLRSDPALGRRETPARPGPLRDARPDAPGSPLTASVSLLVPPPSPRGQPRLRAPCSLPLSVGANLRRPFPGLWPEAALQLAPWPWPWSLRLGSSTG